MTLIIGEAERKKISDVVELAKLNPITAKDFPRSRPDDLKRWKLKLNTFTLDLPVGYVVTYTQELQEYGLCHHISVSNDHGIPVLGTMLLLCDFFGMGDIVAKKNVVKAWPEKYPNGRVALNIMSLVD
jgi:hypothetical protein